MRTFTYPAIFEPGERPGVIVITFPDVPEVISQGDNETDAHEMGRDALGVALLSILAMGRPLPKASTPRPGQVALTADPAMAAKIAVLEAFQDAGITQTELAKRLGKGPEGGSSHP